MFHVKHCQADNTLFDFWNNILFNCVKYKMQAKNNNSNLMRTEIQYKLTHPL